MRINIIAKIIDTKIKAKEVADFLVTKGFNVTHSSNATDEMVKLIREKYNYDGPLDDIMAEKVVGSTGDKKEKPKTSGGKKKHPGFILLKKAKVEEPVEKEVEEAAAVITKPTVEKKVELKEEEKKEQPQEEVKTIAAEEIPFEKKEFEESGASKIIDSQNEEAFVDTALSPVVSPDSSKSSIRQVVFEKGKPKVKEAHKPEIFKQANVQPQRVIDDQPKVIDKKKFVKKDLKQLTHAIQSTQKRATKKKTKLLKLLKKKRIAERLADEMERDVAAEKLVRITDPTTVQELSQKMRVSSADIIKFLLKQGVMSTINQKIDATIAETIALEFGFNIEIEKLFEDMGKSTEKNDDVKENHEMRAPVVTVMGHVDHGKTTLLDAIKKTKVVDTEAGGITQHIGAYKIEYNNKPIVFLDTPGHYAFSSMRSRGASVTDIVILVVAADDGLMPQTLEAINHARAAKAPIIVAINKTDAVGANSERVKQQLSERNLLVESWGGEILDCEISALTNKGIDNLLDAVLLQSEMLELKCNPDVPATGAIIEAAMERGQGPTMTVLIQNGTVRAGDSFVTGIHSGRVRLMLDENNNKLESAGPSTPVKILGCDGVPEAGDPFNVVADEKTARDICEKRQIIKKGTEDKKIKRMTLENLFSQIGQKDQLFLNVILKSDVRGSVEAIHSSLNEIGGEKIKVNIIHEDVGGILESDVMLAASSNAIIIGFKVRPEPAALALAKTENIEIRLYDIIYQLIDDMRKSMSGMLESIVENSVTGTAVVKEVFKINKLGKIAGCLVNHGKILYPSYAKLIRDNIVLYDSKLNSLKHYKNDVKEVNLGQECGMGLENYDDLRVGDILECYVKIETKQEL